jgi:hypothetical protein
VLITRAVIACWRKKQIPSKNQGYTAFTSMWRGNGFIMGPRLFHALPCTQGGLVELAELKMHATLVEGVCLPLSQEGAAGQQHRRPKRHSVRLLQRERQRQPSQRWPALFSRRQTALRSVRVSAHGIPPSALARLHNPAGNWGLS